LIDINVYEEKHSKYFQDHLDKEDILSPVSTTRMTKAVGNCVISNSSIKQFDILGMASSLRVVYYN